MTTADGIEETSRKLADEWGVEGHEDKAAIVFAQALRSVREAIVDKVLAILNCDGTSCPKPCRAMCSNEEHKAIRKLKDSL